MTKNIESINQLAKTVSMLAVDAVEKANSGHPGLPMGASILAATLWANHLRFDPTEPRWLNRDRFIFSPGHGSMLLYSLLNLFCYDVSLSEIKNFRQWESMTPGHPEFGMTPGVEATTGPLGQGFANAVGVALGGKILSAKYGADIFDHNVYSFASDGDLMEGVSSEATSLAGHLGLDNLIVLYDDNKVTLAGETDVCFTESVPKRFKACDWLVLEVDGHDCNALDNAIKQAQSETSRPSLICAHTTIGYGSPNKAGTFGVHGAPLGEKEVVATKKNIGWTQEAFYIPAEVTKFCQEIIKERQQEAERWRVNFKEWQRTNPDLATELTKQINREISAELCQELLTGVVHDKPEASRNLSGKAIQIIAKHSPALLGGSADLETSTKTTIKDGGEIQRNNFKGSNIRFGVREHAMGAIVNGLAYEGLWFPFGSTFLVFSDYMRPSIRVAALSHIQSLFIFTHDSFWVGEDGPTHQPVEQLQSLRLIPNLNVFRPADGIEVGACYLAALQARNRPSALIFSRQDLRPLIRPNGFDPDVVLKGGYVVCDSSDITKHSEFIVIVASGSEVQLAIEVYEVLVKRGLCCRVVSMPRVELFVEQDQSYRDNTIPPQARKFVIEAGRSIGWERIVGKDAYFQCMDHYGASAPGEVLAEKFGFSCDAIVKHIVA